MRSAFDGFDAPDGMARLTRTGILLTVIIVAEQAIAFPQRSRSFLQSHVRQ